ncbi:type 1 glutamine amidotransferase [Sphingomonas sp. SM33]|uniref:Type 1 glutamine amidotransferase n=1 Tax=Sphingomonas telluris TaxID=2907998 RepID=A0ABS9VQP3_9SPHN|nr:type 1 glutamine amidotransferase [Sphingomonas telluris]MCH8617272.1 type 1 glutamine amidotransferase [Sphingomonas telluris]
MKLAILETGRPPGQLAEEFGDYPAMFDEMLGRGFEIEVFDVEAGEFPDRNAHDAVLITGSPAGVYDPHPWIEPLLEFIRSAKESRMVGICFGHQAMAQALGGRVEKSDKGWGAGLHRYDVVRQEPWMDAASSIADPASHQDQVVVQPPNTDVTVASDFTPFAGLAWTDRPAISFQFHPEFSPAFAKALIEKRYDIVPNPDAAMASLDAPNDNARVAGWIRRFLEA